MAEDEPSDADKIVRLNGRLNALELIATLYIMDRANLDQNPFQWIQQYMENMRVILKQMIPDVGNEAKRDRAFAETKIAADEFLEGLIRHSSSLKGAPGNQK